MDDDAEHRARLFWRLADALLIDPAVTTSRMMGFPCLRLGGRFFASLERSTQRLVVKLPAGRVRELVVSGAALPFAPNGRVFKEWAAVPSADVAAWQRLMAEARDFARG